MLRKVDDYQDLAIVIAWPDQTAFGDERWMSMLKKIGIVKNLNFRVGHAAIVLVHRSSGKLAYYDFGRYITPRGYGRARSHTTDPRLTLSMSAEIDSRGKIINLESIIAEIERIEHATHGTGRIFFSVATGLSYTAANKYAEKVMEVGPIKYGAFARANNSCSRFVAQILLAGYTPKHPAKKHVFIPECLKPSPMSNVVNCVPDRIVYCYHKGVLEQKKMNRFQSFYFQLRLLGHNLFSKKAALLPSDQLAPGLVDEPERPVDLPPHTQWLGGVNEGAWFSLSIVSKSENFYSVTRYDSKGEMVYQATCVTEREIDMCRPFYFTYDCGYDAHRILQEDEIILLRTTESAELMVSDMNDVS
ncbi:DUF6695 family protein [Olivibacter sitiensis]|uniref:DUF6695 family protein n=1 Tax=Olivibacter sitiensis TaxID=376470 RepID=UPI0004212316|nr:DUF6695 family protein [Olivibacter sitiensis]